MLQKIDKGIEWVANWIVIITGVAVCGLIFACAVIRYVVKSDFYGSEDLILLTAFWLYFAGSALAAKKDTHIAAEMLSMFCHNPKVLACAEIFKNICCCGLSAVATVWAFNYMLWTKDMNMTSNVLKFPIMLAVLPIFISFLLWTIYLVRDTIKSIGKLRTAGNEAAKEEE